MTGAALLLLHDFVYPSPIATIANCPYVLPPGEVVSFRSLPMHSCMGAWEWNYKSPGSEVDCPIYVRLQTKYKMVGHDNPEFVGFHPLEIMHSEICWWGNVNRRETCTSLSSDHANNAIRESQWVGLGVVISTPSLSWLTTPVHQSCSPLSFPPECNWLYSWSLRSIWWLQSIKMTSCLLLPMLQLS